MMWMYVLIGGLIIALILLLALWFRCHDAYVGIFAVNQGLVKTINGQNEELVLLRQLGKYSEISNRDTHKLMMEARAELLKAHAKMAVMEMRDKILSESMGHRIQVFKMMLKSPITSDAEKTELIDAAYDALKTNVVEKYNRRDEFVQKHDIGGEA